MKTRRKPSSVLCEACETRRAQPRCTGVDRRLHPSFLLCRPCEGRLDRLSLRPLEWYNLAKRHGPYHRSLSVELYGPAGHAIMPVDELEEQPHLLPAPVLQEVAHDLGLLWDHTLTRRQIRPGLRAAWRRHPKAAVAAHLAAAWDSRREFHARHCILTLCRDYLGRAGAALARRACAENAAPRDHSSHVLRDEPNDRDDDDDLDDDDESPFEDPDDDWSSLLPSVVARCLPREEAWQHALAQVTKYGHMGWFDALGDPRALDWIETHLPSGTYPGWGPTAARCGFSWDRALRWLRQGRPLSHLALDALSELISPLADPERADHVVRLLDPPGRRTLSRVLKAHARRDAVPRVQNQVDFILHHAPVLLEGKPYSPD